MNQILTIFEMGIRDSCSCNNNIWITTEVIHNFQLIASSQTSSRHSLKFFLTRRRGIKG